MRQPTTRATIIGAALLAAAALAPTAGVARQEVSPASDPANWRPVEPGRLIVMDTTKGRILIETAPEFAPNHVARFTLLIRSGFYDGTVFHRVIDDFMVQGGDPRGDGTGGTGTNIDAEFTIERDASLPVVEVSDRIYNRGGFFHGMPVETQPIAQAMVRASGTVETWLSHCAGVVSTARGGSGDPVEDRALQNTADSQFFMMRYSTNAEGASNTFLDANYTAWGKVVGGLDVVRAMNVGTVRQTPGFVPDSIETVQIAADMAEDARPRVWVLREDGPAFGELVASLTDEDGNAPDVCDIEIPTVVEDPAAP